MNGPETTTTALVPQAATKEVLNMLSEQDIEIGRYSSGWDADTDFDALPSRLVDISQADVESADLFTGEEIEPVEFEAPLDAFPVFRGALRHFQAEAPGTRAVRIDTDQSYIEFGADKAVAEIARRAEDLRAAVSDRVTDEILGAVAAIADLKNAATPGEALAKMPQVPLSIPDFAQGAVKCWRDGDAIVVSIRFAMPDGSARVATMGSKPRVNEGEIEQWAESQGIDPVTILGALPEIASVATGKQLVRDTAQAALEARAREDVHVMESDDEPMVFIGLGETSAPIAAVMHVQQRAENGDAQAARELAMMYDAASTPQGRVIAAPVLAEASRRLTAGRATKNPSFADSYAKLSAFV